MDELNTLDNDVNCIRTIEEIQHEIFILRLHQDQQMYLFRKSNYGQRFHARLHMHKSNPLCTSQLKRMEVYRHICQERDQIYMQTKFLYYKFTKLCLILKDSRHLIDDFISVSIVKFYSSSDKQNSCQIYVACL